MEKKITFNQVLNGMLIAIFTTAIFWSAYKMALIAYPYLVPPYPTDIDFLESKQWVVEEWYWLTAFYIHITSAVIVLAAGVTQFSKFLMFRYSKIHRTIGKIYVFLILVVACPSGFVMAFYGNGGPPAQVAFVLQAISWWFLTFMAYRTIRVGKIEEHGRYMMRSYAMTLSAISLRGATYIVSQWKMKHGIICPDSSYYLICYPDFYVLVAWLSWIVNLVVAELLIIMGVMRYYLPTKK